MPSPNYCLQNFSSSLEIQPHTFSLNELKFKPKTLLSFFLVAIVMGKFKSSLCIVVFQSGKHVYTVFADFDLRPPNKTVKMPLNLISVKTITFRVKT